MSYVVFGVVVISSCQLGVYFVKFFIGGFDWMFCFIFVKFFGLWSIGILIGDEMFSEGVILDVVQDCFYIFFDVVVDYMWVRYVVVIFSSIGN